MFNFEVEPELCNGGIVGACFAEAEPMTLMKSMLNHFYRLHLWFRLYYNLLDRKK